MNYQLPKIFSRLIGVVLLATIVFYYAGLNMGLQEVGFNIMFPLIFAITLLVDKGISIFRTQETFLFFLFLILVLSSVYYPNISMEYFQSAFNKSIAAFIGAYIAIVLSSKLHLEDYFHLGFIISFLVIIYFEYSLGTFKPATFYAPTALRSDFSYNANYYSYMSLFANFSIFRLYLKYKSKWAFVGLFLIPFLGIAISFTVQTRSGIIFILLINTLFWFWVNKGKLKNPIFAIMRKLFLALAALVVIFQFFVVYSESNIKGRMSSKIAQDSRSYLVDKGIEVFLNHPFTGVGAGNFVKYNRLNAFTHNNYLEALAEHGLFIGALIILVFLLPFYKSFKLFLTNKLNPEYKLCLLFFAIFILYNNVYVFYKASNAMMYFFLMIGIHYQLYRTAKKT